MSAVDPGSAALSQYREISIQELIEQYEVVKVDEGNRNLGTSPFIVVSESGGIKLAGTPNIDAQFGIQELGYTSMSPWTAWTREELIPELRNKQGIRKFYDMKRNDGAVRGSLRLLKTPIQAAHWFVEPASDSALDKNIADFVKACLFDKLNVNWSQVLDDVLLIFEYGYMVFEKVYDIDRDGKVVLKKLGPRHPLDIQEWIFDDHGGPAGIVMEPFVPYGNQYITGNNSPYATTDQFGAVMALGQFIPINKLVIFSLEAEAGDLRGISVLRSAYKHWYYKDTLYKIDAIQKERHGIGVPIIKLPPGFSPADKKLADELGRNLRTNDRAHIVVPANWEIMFAVLGGNPVSAIESINHHNDQILLNILAPFITDARVRDVAADMFLKSTRYLADAVASIFNKHIIEQLVDLNFARGKYPKLRARRIGEWDDLRTLSFAVRNFVGAGLITPDDVLEASLREETDLPKMDKATQRIPVTPQVPGGGAPGDGGDANAPSAPKPPKAGPPRQGPPSTGGSGAPTKGRDASGG